jgi:hypothetical protein
MLSVILSSPVPPGSGVIILQKRIAIIVVVLRKQVFEVRGKDYEGVSNETPQSIHPDRIAGCHCNYRITDVDHCPGIEQSKVGGAKDSVCQQYPFTSSGCKAVC